MSNFNFIYPLLLIFLLTACTNQSQQNITFLGSAESQKINNLSDLDEDKKSELIFWNTSTMAKPNDFLKPCFLEFINPIKNKYFKFDFGELGDIPFIGYFDHDSVIDYGVYRFSEGNNEWQIRNGRENSGINLKLGEKGDIPVPGDYNGDGKFDLVIYRPQDNSFRGSLSNTGALFSVRFEEKGNIPIPKDYDGDGISDFAIYAVRTGKWTIKNSSNNSILKFNLGGINFLPIPSDYDGDGKADICVWNYLDNSLKVILSTLQRPISNEILEKIKNTLKNKEFFPMPGDYDGNGISELAFWDNKLKLLITFDIREENFKKKIYHLTKITNSIPVNNFLLNKFLLLNKLNKNSVVSIDRKPTLISFKDGKIYSTILDPQSSILNPQSLFNWNKKQNVILFVADFDGDYNLDSCLWSKDTGTFLCKSSLAKLNFALELGTTSDTPVIGNFNGDNITDLGIYRKKEQKFLIRFLGKSSPQDMKLISFSEDVGLNGIPLIFDYTGDELDDFCVFNPKTNKFFIKSFENENIEIIDFCKYNICIANIPVFGDFDGDNALEPGIIDLKTKKFYFFNRTSNNLSSIQLDENVSGLVFSGDIDQDLISDLFFYDENKNTIGFTQSSKNNEYLEVMIHGKNSELVNCPSCTAYENVVSHN